MRKGAARWNKESANGAREGAKGHHFGRWDNTLFVTRLFAMSRPGGSEPRVRRGEGEPGLTGLIV